MVLSNLLLKATSLSEEQLTVVLQSSSLTKNATDGEKLAQKNVSSADDVVAELCKELGIEFMRDVPYNDISADLVRDIPINYSRSQGVLPFKEEQELVTVLVSNPLNMKALD